MFSVIFEVLPSEGRKDDYLEKAKFLKPIIETIDGFIDNERFESRLKPGWILSHSAWRDEKSLVRWRTVGEHHAMQEKGRFEVFADYRLRVGEATFDTNPPREAAIQEQRLDETEVGRGKFVTFTEITASKGAAFASQANLLLAQFGLDQKDGDIVDHGIYDSIYNPGKFALLIGWTNAEAAGRWSPRKTDGVEKLRHRRIRVVRDYGRFDRREAPQYYADVKGRETLHAKRVEPAG
ncbi:MAG: antibiotic biosynthesis monooxygenase family protein [Bradyrhizobium sp.]